MPRLATLRRAVRREQRQPDIDIVSGRRRNRLLQLTHWHRCPMAALERLAQQVRQVGVGQYEQWAHRDGASGKWRRSRAAPRTAGNTEFYTTLDDKRLFFIASQRPSLAGHRCVTRRSTLDGVKRQFFLQPVPALSTNARPGQRADPRPAARITCRGSGRKYRGRRLGRRSKGLARACEISKQYYQIQTFKKLTACPKVPVNRPLRPSRVGSDGSPRSRNRRGPPQGKRRILTPPGRQDSSLARLMLS